MQDQQNGSGNNPVQAPVPQTAPTEQQPVPTQNDYLHPVTDPPKHTYHPKRIMIALTIAVLTSLLIVGLLVVYAIMPRHESTANTETSSTKKIEVDTLTAEETLKHVKTILKDGKAAQQAIGLPVSAPKKTFYTVIPDAAPVQGLSESVDDSKTKALLTSLEKSFATDKYTTRNVRELTDANGYLSYHTRDDVVCQSTATVADATTKQRTVEVDCIDMARYTEYADAQQPFASAYTPATTSSVLVAFTGKPIVNPSATAGYHLVEIPVSTVIEQKLTSFGTVASFYQTADGLWHYFLDHDSTLVECVKYNKPDLLYAYAGKACQNSKTTTQDVVVAPKGKK